jgi:hypothetical protein
VRRAVASGLLALLVFESAFAETDWERYVAQPTPANARAVGGIEYSPGGDQPLMRDLEVLQRQVLAGEREAIRLAFRAATAEPVLLQWLYPMLGRLSLNRPRIFLEELQRAGSQEPRDLLLSLKAEPSEMRMRAAALRGVADPGLAALRDECVGALLRRAATIDALVKSPLNAEVTIVDAWFGAKLVTPCSRPGPRAQGFWNPGFEEIMAAEQRLAPYLAEAKQCGAPLQPPQRYLRQYVGVLIDGKRALYLNAFDAETYAQMKKIEPDVADWKTHPYDTCQAGMSHWGVEYDLDSARFANLNCSAGSATTKP